MQSEEFEQVLAWLENIPESIGEWTIRDTPPGFQTTIRKYASGLTEVKVSRKIPLPGEGVPAVDKSR